MGLYKLFTCNVEVQYKSSFLSKAMIFTIIITGLNIILPFIIAYRSRGFWLRTATFFEQPIIQFTYEYVLIAETDDPSQAIICSEPPVLNVDHIGEDNCAQMQVQEYDDNDDGKYDSLEVQYLLNIPQNRTISSITLILGLDFKLQSVCPLHMQSLAILEKAFSINPSAFVFYGDVQLYQIVNLLCKSNIIDTQYNNSVFNYYEKLNLNNYNMMDITLQNYFRRQVTTQTKTLHTRSQNGHTGNMHVKVHLRVPEMKIRYLPSLLQELKWAWPQYLSLAIIFYWVFDKIKKFVFKHRLLMAWEIVPWKKH